MLKIQKRLFYSVESYSLRGCPLKLSPLCFIFYSANLKQPRGRRNYFTSNAMRRNYLVDRSEQRRNWPLWSWLLLKVKSPTWQRQIIIIKKEPNVVLNVLSVKQFGGHLFIACFWCAERAQIVLSTCIPNTTAVPWDFTHNKIEIKHLRCWWRRL